MALNTFYFGYGYRWPGEKDAGVLRSLAEMHGVKFVQAGYRYNGDYSHHFEAPDQGSTAANDWLERKVLLAVVDHEIDLGTNRERELKRRRRK